MPIKHLSNGYEAYGEGFTSPMGTFKELEEAQAACALLATISDISESWWSAGWMSGIEYDLWDKLHNPSPNFSDDRLYTLSLLSSKCKGWIWYDRERGEQWVSLDEWEKMFNDWKEGE